MAANGLDILCSTTILREQTPATYCRKKGKQMQQWQKQRQQQEHQQKNRNGKQNNLGMLKGAMVQYQTRNDGTAKNTARSPA